MIKRIKSHYVKKHLQKIFVTPALGKLSLLLCISLLPMLYQSIASATDPVLKLAPDEIVWLNENKDNISYGPNPYWPPGDYMENGEHKGIVSDYIKIFEERLGITFKKVYYNDWKGFYNGLKNGEFDFAGACQETKERKTFLVFTKPFLTTRLAVLTRKNSNTLNSLDDLNSMKLAGIKGYSSLDYVKTKYPGAKIVECEDDLAVLLKVSAGAVDGAVTDYMIASYLVDKYSITNIKFATELDFHWDLRFAIQKEKPKLRSILDKILSSISEEERQKIYHKWVNINLERKQSLIEQYQNIIIGIFLFVLFFLFVVILFNRSLKKQVFMHTKELKINADRLLKNKEYLKAVLDSAGDAIIVNDADTGKIIDVNHRMIEMYGYSYTEALEMNFEKLSMGESPFSQVDAMELFRKSREIGQQTFNWISRHKDDHTFWVEVKISFAVIGGEKRFVIVLRDITERKKIEEQLMKAQKLEALGVLAGGIAHDFNNILSPIVGFSEMLIDDLPMGSIEYENAVEIYNAGKRGRELTKQILAFSRQSEQKKMPVRIQFILKEVIKLIRSTIPANIDISQDIQNDCSLIMADPTQLHQVSMNLITNAYHAVENKSGKITIQLREVEIGLGQSHETELLQGRYALLSVSDTGIGIDPTIMNKIFEPYFTTKEQGKGTGLGLSLVHGIVKKYHGDIKVTSEFGKGTTFSVYWPIIAQAEETALIDRKDDISTGHERILLVDDNEPIARLEKQILKRHGYNVTMCIDSLEALEAFKANPSLFDLVISDMTMPNMTGDILARELITIRPDIPIIICTGFSERLNKEQITCIGIKKILMKPITKAEMANIVRSVLDTAKKNLS